MPLLGRLVDSKAKTRSAGCAAYMAPERIDPPHPSKGDYHYDIRADVWSLGITLVEMATGHFPYKVRHYTKMQYLYYLYVDCSGVLLNFLPIKSLVLF